MGATIGIGRAFTGMSAADATDAKPTIATAASTAD
jgi:hypothetical protein